MATSIRKGQRPRLPLAAAFLMLATIVACKSDEDPRGRVLLVGIDGASPRVMDALLDADRVPNLGGIAHSGVYGPLRAFPPFFSPPLWNTIATGKSPAKHGIRFFVAKDDDGSVRLLLSSDRKTHALWNIASDAGLTVGVINWWNTYPPERIDGVMISDHVIPRVTAELREGSGAPEPVKASVTYPETWQEPTRRMLAVPPSLTTFSDPFAGNRQLPSWIVLNDLSAVFREDDAIVRMALAVEAAITPDLLMVFLPGIDRVSHRLWGSIEPPELYEEEVRMTSGQAEASRKALYGYYEYTDALIGLLLDRYSRDDLIVVVSDHGFEATVPNPERRALATGMHWTAKARDGVIFARGARIAARYPPAGVTVNDVTPSILAWLGLPPARDMDGTRADFVLSRTLDPVDTYDSTAVSRLDAQPSGAEGELIERLQGLGYLE